ncbi:hypothetical protein [Streptomyces sp. BH105]|uniref:hypothetical protein n=1 Tax=Streptomyces sp. BH105 TaxID=3410408 RepID=UPI003CF5E49F
MAAASRSATRSWGLAHDDYDLIEFLRRTGLDDAEALVFGDSPQIQWRGGRAHEYEAA